MAYQGYSRRDSVITLNAGDEAAGAWVALNKPDLIDEAAQGMSLDFNAEREKAFRTSNEGLREALQLLFANGVERPRSIGAVIRHYAKEDNFLYGVVNPLYERAVGSPLPEAELLAPAQFTASLALVPDGLRLRHLPEGRQKTRVWTPQEPRPP
jgi:hypothetical protein